MFVAQIHEQLTSQIWRKALVRDRRIQVSSLFVWCAASRDSKFVVVMTALGAKGPDSDCFAVVSPEKIEFDLAPRRNSAFIHWKRPGLNFLRKEPHLIESYAENESEEEIILPPIPQEELIRMIDAIQRSGQAIDIEAKETDGVYSDGFLTKDETVNILVTRANRGDQDVLNQVENGNVNTWFARVQPHVKCADVCSAILLQLLTLMDSQSAGVRALAITAVQRIARSNAPEENRMMLTLLVCGRRNMRT